MMTCIRVSEVLSLFLLFGCTDTEAIHDVYGIYTTYKPPILERIRTDIKLEGQTFPLSVAMIYFRRDETYVLGFCDNQICEVGRFTVSKDSVLLYDRHNLDDRSTVPSRSMLFDARTKILYFTYPHEDPPLKRFKNRILPLKKDWSYAHVGFLREQDMAMDSILGCYQQYSPEYQINWTDSVRKLRNQHR